MPEKLTNRNGSRAPSARPLRVSCPTCGLRFGAEQSVCLPFCSERCRHVDLGRWLDEAYGLPIEREDREQEESEPR